MIQDTSSQDVVLSPDKLPKSKIKFIILMTVVIIIAVVAYPSVASWSSADASVSIDRVRMAQVVRGDFVSDYALQGNIVAAHSPKLYAPFQGHVELIANPGQQVQKGELVARVASPELTNRLLQEKSQQESLQIEWERTRIEEKQAQIKNAQQVKLEKVILDAAERELRRAEQSLKAEVISQIDYEKAIDDLKRAKLKYDFSVEQAALDKEKLAFEVKTKSFALAQYQLLVDNTERLVKSLELTAPVSGVVGSWSVEQRSAVEMNQALITIVDLSTFEVEIDIPESFSDDLGLGMKTFVTYNGEQYEAAIASISPEVTNNVVKGRIAFTNEPPPGLKQNQRVTSRVILQSKNDVLYLPRGSFTQHHAGKQIFVVDAGAATLQPITLGSQSIDKIEVVSGLTEGQQVIISNTDFVQQAKRIILN